MSFGGIADLYLRRKGKGTIGLEVAFALARDPVAGIVLSLVVASFIHGRDTFLPEVVSWMIVLGVYGLISFFSANRQHP